jgi:hypothetical protein
LIEITEDENQAAGTGQAYQALQSQAETFAVVFLKLRKALSPEIFMRVTVFFNGMQ